MKNLIDIIQADLDKMHSTIQLQNIKDILVSETNCLCATIENRDFYLGYAHNGNIAIEIGEYDIHAGEIDTQNPNIIANILDLWLTKNETIYNIKNQYVDFEIDEKYPDFLVLTNAELLEKRWTQLYNSIEKDNQLFDKILFLVLKTKLFNLYPSFTHGLLWFSDIIGKHNENYPTPCIVCHKDVFFVSSFNTNFPVEVVFETKNIAEALEKITSLLPPIINEARNPIPN